MLVLSMGRWLHLRLGERFLPLLLCERDLTTIIVSDDDLAGVVVDFHGRATALSATELDSRDIRLGIASFFYFFQEV